MSIKTHFKSFFTFLILRIKGEEPILSGQCYQCGQCCRAFRVKSENKWIKNKKQFKALVNKKPEYSRLIIIDTIDGYLDFTCSWLTSEGICKDHENRLPICREYPTTGRFYTGKKLPDYCGYAINAGVPFEKVLKKKLKHRNIEIKTNLHD
ncbi:protein belonging to Uncharacterized protein family UPF0153 [Candidatus Magnetomorum sp. HK-1]|nr:protein belonging to Uncharacterized protein family UPF0153 [Candidatus Magnetomorum sp. HK-1]